MRPFMIAAILTISCAGLRADFSYTETTKMTGGTLYDTLRLGGPFTRKAREAQVSTVAIAGNKMYRSNKESINIIDLDKETITDIDISKKTYTVVTFEEMRRAMQKAMAELQEKQKETKEKPKDAKDPNVEVKFKVSSKATGETKDVSGLTAKELVISMEADVKDKDTGNSGAMNIVSDAWMADVPGYNEVKEFELKMAKKMGSMFDPAQAQLAISQPQMVSGMAEASKEMAKVDGVPVEHVVKMGSGPTEELMKTGGNGNGDKKSEKSVGKVAAGAAVSSITGGLGGFGGFGKKKKTDEDKKDTKTDDAKADAPQAVLLMEMTTQMSDFSRSVDAAKYAIPANFKQTESDVTKRANSK